MIRRILSAGLALAIFTAGGISAQNKVRDEFVVGMGSYGVELHPYKTVYSHDMQALNALYEGLFSYDPETMDPVRAHAETFSKSADGKTWTFSLRADLRWSDGSPITAEDYVESWRYLLAPSSAAEFAVFFDIIKGARDYRTGRNKDPASVAIRADGERSLVVELEAPTAYFTRLLCHMSFVPVHASLRGKESWEPSDVISSGPYRMVSMSGSELLLAKNSHYWDAASVAIGSLRILFLESEAEATARYNDGEIHWLMDMADADSLASVDDIQYAPSFGTGYYFWNAAKRPWSDARVRRALALLIPWESIRTEDKYYAPTSRLIYPFSGYVSPDGIDKADLEEAKKLLAAAGYRDPAKLPTALLMLPDTPTHNANAAIIADAWSALGIATELRHPGPDDNIRELRKQGYSLSFTSWIGDFADPAAFLLMWTSDSSLNEASYKSKEYDELVRRSSGEEGPARMASLAKAEAKLLSDAAVLPVYHSLSFDVIDTGFIKGWYINPMDVHPFKALSFGAPKARPLVASATGEKK
jgi:peptide/nickel transport system substrate-binding protein/oligopeptide transport system substrate-binding protein